MQLNGTLDLEPDDAAIYNFLREWFRGCNRGVIEFGWTDEHNGQLTKFRRFELDDLHAAARFAAETNAKPGVSVYFRPATVRPNSHYTADRDIVQVPGCWVDCDSEDAIERVLAGPLPPSMQIITGQHPTKRAQFLWQLSGDPLLIGDWSRHLNRQAQTLAGSRSRRNQSIHPAQITRQHRVAMEGRAHTRADRVEKMGRRRFLPGCSARWLATGCAGCTSRSHEWRCRFGE
jgi:hypothetical protein